MQWTAQEKQQLFLNEVFNPDGANEILFGGAAGGGKTDSLLAAAIVWCNENPKTWVLFLRRTFTELEQKPIPRSKELLFPSEVATYNESKHRWTFSNGAVLQFGSLDKDGDETKYQSAEFSLIIFDELTLFTKNQYLFMISRNRSTNCKWKPKIIAGTNPGGVGHFFVMDRWQIGNQGLWYKRWKVPQDAEDIKLGLAPRKRCFIHSTVDDNQILLQANPGYKQALKEMDKAQRDALLNGIWSSLEGQYFTCWNYDKHVIQPFDIPGYWKHFLSLDYGLDMTALYEHVTDESGKVYTVKELCQPDLSIPEATQEILNFITPGVKYEYLVVSPDLYNRRQETGRSGIEIMFSNGLRKIGCGVVPADNARVSGWQNMSDYLYLRKDEEGGLSPRWQIFNTCPELIKCIPALMRSKNNPDDVAGEPHELTHSPESCRYFLKSRPSLSHKKKSHYYESYQKPVVSSKTGW